MAAAGRSVHVANSQCMQTGFAPYFFTESRAALRTSSDIAPGTPASSSQVETTAQARSNGPPRLTTRPPVSRFPPRATPGGLSKHFRYRAAMYLAIDSETLLSVPLA